MGSKSYQISLPKDVALRIVSKVDLARENPGRFFERLVGEEFYRLRVGDYRVFADLFRNPDVIKVRGVRHRRDAYKRK